MMMREIPMMDCQDIGAGRAGGGGKLGAAAACYEGGKVGWGLATSGNEGCAAAIGCVAAVSVYKAGGSKTAQEVAAASHALASNKAYERSGGAESSNSFNCMIQQNSSGDFDNGSQGWVGGGC